MNKIMFLVMLTIQFMSTETQGNSSTVPYYISNAATAHNLDVALMYAICTVESHCKTSAINTDDATASRKLAGIKEHSLGLFQIKMATARGLGFKGSKKELMKPEINSWYAAKLLRSLYDRYDENTVKAVSGYNAGRYTKANKDYVNKVLKNYARFKIDRKL